MAFDLCRLISFKSTNVKISCYENLLFFLKKRLFKSTATWRNRLFILSLALSSCHCCDRSTCKQIIDLSDLICNKFEFDCNICIHVAITKLYSILKEIGLGEFLLEMFCSSSTILIASSLHVDLFKRERQQTTNVCVSCPFAPLRFSPLPFSRSLR